MLPGSSRTVGAGASAGMTGPAQVSFGRDGDTLVVTERGLYAPTNRMIDTWVLNHDGMANAGSSASLSGFRMQPPWQPRAFGVGNDKITLIEGLVSQRANELTVQPGAVSYALDVSAVLAAHALKVNARTRGNHPKAEGWRFGPGSPVCFPVILWPAQTRSRVAPGRKSRSQLQTDDRRIPARWRRFVWTGIALEATAQTAKN